MTRRLKSEKSSVGKPIGSDLDFSGRAEKTLPYRLRTVEIGAGDKPYVFCDVAETSIAGGIVGSDRMVHDAIL